MLPLHINSIISCQPSLHGSIIKHCLSQTDLPRQPQAKVCNATLVILSSLQLSQVWWWKFVPLHWSFITGQCLFCPTIYIYIHAYIEILSKNFRVTY